MDVRIDDGKDYGDGKAGMMAMQWTEALEDEKEERFVLLLLLLLFVSFLSCTQMAKKKKKKSFSFDFFGNETVRRNLDRRGKIREKVRISLLSGDTPKRIIFYGSNRSSFFTDSNLLKSWEERNVGRRRGGMEETKP